MPFISRRTEGPWWAPYTPPSLMGISVTLSEVAEGQRCFVKDKIDGTIRETHFIRLSGEARLPGFVKVARVRIVQGEYDTGEFYCTDPGEAFGKTQVLPFEQSSIGDGK